MKLSKLIVILMLLVASLMASGCSPWLFPFLSKPVYVPPGHIAEVAKPARICVWVINKETQKRELRNLVAQPGWMVGRVGNDSE